MHDLIFGPHREALVLILGISIGAAFVALLVYLSIAAFRPVTFDSIVPREPPRQP